MPTFIVYVDLKSAEERGVDLTSFGGPLAMARQLEGVEYHAFLLSEMDDPRIGEFEGNPRYKKIQVDGN